MSNYAPCLSALSINVLSYLNPKEKAQITDLTKEWLRALQTNHTLELDDRYLQKNNPLFRDFSHPEDYSGCREGKEKLCNYVNSTSLS